MYIFLCIGRTILKKEQSVTQFSAKLKTLNPIFSTSFLRKEELVLHFLPSYRFHTQQDIFLTFLESLKGFSLDPN